jgi:hypothetical protein
MRLNHTTQNIKLSEWVSGSNTLISIGYISEPETRVCTRFEFVIIDIKVLTDSDVSVCVMKLRGFSHKNKAVVE